MTGWAHKHRPWRRALRSLRHAVEWLLQSLVMGIFWMLPLDWASNFGGWLARQIGSRLPVSDRARKHLGLAFPDMAEDERRRIVAGMWDNLGRLIAEYPHLGAIADPKSGRMEVHHAERLIAAQQDGKRFIAISGHLANFELLPISAYTHGIKIAAMARRVNNPFIDRSIRFFRERPTGSTSTIPKGTSGGRQALQLLQQGLSLALLVDHRVSKGATLQLFDKPARTTLAAARLAIDQDLPLFPVHLERLGGARFRLTVEPPVARPQLGDRREEAKAMMTEVNKILERWITQRPEDWLWLHRRWDRP